MNRFFTKCLAGGIALAIVVSASAVLAVPVYLDLGDNVNPVLPGGDQWNQLSGAMVDDTGSSIADLQDASGAATGVGVSVTVDFQGQNVTGGAAWAMPAWAVEGMVSDSFFLNDGSFPTGAITFTGLDDTKVYNFSVLSSRDGAAPRGGTFLLGGDAPGNHVGVFDAKTDGTDANKAMTWLGISSTGGVLVLDVATDVAGGSTFSYLNAVRFELIPEPSSIALLGLCAVSFIMRGRRRS